MAQMAGIPKLIIDNAMQYHKKISEYDQTFRGDNKDGLIAASIYISCRINNYPRTVKELATIFHLDPKSATRGCKNAQTIINDLDYSNFDRAVAFYVVNKCSFSGLTESSSFSKQASSSNFSLNGIEKLKEYSKLIGNWRITNYSYDAIMDSNKNAFMYLDPPYDIKDNLYGNKGSMHKGFDHDLFAARCGVNSMDMLVSYNSDQLVKDRFTDPEWKAAEFDLTYTMRSVGEYMREQKKRKELLLFNYEIRTEGLD